MKARADTATHSFWQEWPFWLCLALGPVCWLMMSWVGVPVRNGAPPLKTLIWVALLYPILEEYIFRGGLQAALIAKASLKKSVFGITLANVITSIIFAAMHLFSQSPLWAALVFFPSLVFGWMRDRYANIHASIALHISYNAGFVWLYSG